MKVRVLAVHIAMAAMTALPAFAAPPRPPDAVRLHALDGMMEVTWIRSPDDPLNVAGYEVVRSGFSSGPYDRVCVTLKGAVRCTDRRAEPARIYYYKVRAMGIGNEGMSDFTREVRGEMPPAPPPPEPPPPKPPYMPMQ